MITNSDIIPISLKDLTDLNDIATSHIFKPGQVIFYEGHLPYGLFILLDGTIEMINKKNCEKINAGAILGINSFLNSDFYSGTAKAVTSCKVNFLSKSTFHDLAQKNYKQIPWIKEMLN
jgi:CRP-like cAMP-binding protein